MRNGPGRVMAVLASSAVPLRPAGLALLLRERAIADTLDAYRGDLCWSILQSLHVMCKSQAEIMSYSDMVDQLRRRPDAAPRQMTNEQVIDRVESMLDYFCKEG
jgi:hypothetical protein